MVKMLRLHNPTRLLVISRPLPSPLYLPLPVHTDDATASLVYSCHEDGLSTDTVHVDASASLKIVEMNVAKLGDEVDDVVLGTHLMDGENMKMSTSHLGGWGLPAWQRGSLSGPQGGRKHRQLSW